MPKNKDPIPKAPLHRILKENGATRVSDEALEFLSKKIEDEIKIISEEAIKFAKHAKRKTVLEEDILIAIKENKK